MDHPTIERPRRRASALGGGVGGSRSQIPRAHIASLRRKLKSGRPGSGRSAAGFIRSDPGVGYRLAE